MQNKGIINITRDDLTHEETNTLRDYFVRLAQIGIHRFKNGKVVMHFDHDGTLQKITTDKTEWKRKKA